LKQPANSRGRMADTDARPKPRSLLLSSLKRRAGRPVALALMLERGGR
jgi:hypothetical protein